MSHKEAEVQGDLMTNLSHTVYTWLSWERDEENRAMCCGPMLGIFKHGEMPSLKFKQKFIWKIK